MITDKLLIKDNIIPLNVNDPRKKKRDNLYSIQIQLIQNLHFQKKTEKKLKSQWNATFFCKNLLKDDKIFTCELCACCIRFETHVVRPGILKIIYIINYQTHAPKVNV